MFQIKLLLFWAILGFGAAKNQTKECNSSYVRQSITSDVELQLNLLRNNILLVQEKLEKHIKGGNNQLEDNNKLLQQLTDQILTTLEESFQKTIKTTFQELASESSNKTVTIKPPTTSESDHLPLVGTFENPAKSCNDIPKCSKSGEYWIWNNKTDCPVQVYCDTKPRECSCNSTGGWMRVAKLDMTNPNEVCPKRFRCITSSSPPLRLCGKTGPLVGCVSTTFPVHGIQYSRVCGRIIGYQYGAPFVFSHGTYNIESEYVDGFSLTHGQSPRKHIWSFAGGSDDTTTYSWVCPCSGAATFRIPPFVGEDYFCETANHISSWTISTRFYDHPLWDGEQCGPRSNDKCCSFNNPPWFCKELSQPTTDDIELRQCNGWRADSDTPFEIVEIYVN